MAQFRLGRYQLIAILDVLEQFLFDLGQVLPLDKEITGVSRYSFYSVVCGTVLETRPQELYCLVFLSDDIVPHI